MEKWEKSLGGGVLIKPWVLLLRGSVWILRADGRENHALQNVYAAANDMVQQSLVFCKGVVLPSILTLVSCSSLFFFLLFDASCNLKVALVNRNTSLWIVRRCQASTAIQGLKLVCLHSPLHWASSWNPEIDHVFQTGSLWIMGGIKLWLYWGSEEQWLGWMRMRRSWSPGPVMAIPRLLEHVIWTSCGCFEFVIKSWKCSCHSLCYLYVKKLSLVCMCSFINWYLVSWWVSAICASRFC